jgi:Fe-S-cluster containining protein
MDDVEIPNKFCNGCGVCCQGEWNGLIERPFLTPYDVDNIVKETGLPESDFVDNLYLSENNIKVLRTKQIGKGCMFFDDDTRRCKIYHSRPLDCRLFPLDMVKEDGRYYLILYPDVCPSDIDLIAESIQPTLDKVLPLLKNYIREYATFENGIEKNRRWKKVTEIHLDKNVVVKECKIGKGVFTMESIREGEFIFSYGGFERISFEETKNKDIEDYCLQIAPREYIYPIESPQRYINHSCEPNAGLRDTAELYALCDISAGEEITFDYSTCMDEDDWEIDCLCGSPNCRKRIRDFKYLPDEIQEKYLSLGFVGKFILDSNFKKV